MNVLAAIAVITENKARVSIAITISVIVIIVVTIIKFFSATTNIRTSAGFVSTLDFWNDSIRANPTDVINVSTHLDVPLGSPGLSPAVPH